MTATNSTNTRPVKGKQNVGIITGASSGIGLEFAKQIDKLGVCDELWLVARNEDKLNEVAATLKTPSIAVPADLSKDADIATIADRLGAGNLNVAYLVNSAGFGKFGAWDQIPVGVEETMVDLDAKAVVTLTKACLPHMSRGSNIIQVASVAAFMPLPYMNVYAACKSFVLRYTRALRWELRGTGITATALCPAWVKTNFEQTARKDGDEKSVHSTPFAQSASVVVERALEANNRHAAVCSAGPISLFLRFACKVVPDCVVMGAWDIIRKL